METNESFTPPQPVKNNNENVAAILSYFGIILWLIAYFAIHKDKKTEFGSYHLRQTLLFAIVSMVIGFGLSILIGIIAYATGFGAFIYITNVAYIILFIMWIIGFIGALQGKKTPIPFIGEMAQTMFPNI